jgi:hypothetical protein
MYVMKTYKLERKNIVENAFYILNYTKLINPDNTTFEIALFSAFGDLEDAVQYYTALEIKGVDYVVTSNIKDLRAHLCNCQVISPHEFMNKYNLL